MGLQKLVKGEVKLAFRKIAYEEILNIRTLVKGLRSLVECIKVARESITRPTGNCNLEASH